MKKMQNVMLNSYHGAEHLSFLGQETDPRQAIAEKLAQLVEFNATHAYSDIYQAIAVRHCTTDHKTFDKQTDCIMEGNISSNVMRGQYIRPASETECNGFTFAPGQLQKSDIESFQSREVQSALYRWAELLPEMKTETTIAYAFFTYSGRVKTHIGYMLVRAKDRKVLRYHAVGERAKNESVMYAMRVRLSDEGVEQRTRIATWSANGLSVYDPAIFGLLKALGVQCCYQGPLGTVRHSK